MAQRFIERHFWRVFGAIWLAVGVPFLVAGLAVLWRDQRVREGFRNGAREVTATVLVKSRTGESPERYTVGYRYTLPGGAKRYGSARLAVTQWEALTELGPVAVQYLIADDKRSRPGGAIDDTFLGPLFAAMGGVFSTAGALLVFRKSKPRKKA